MNSAAHASEDDAEQLARMFHETYERLAPNFGYETRKETREFQPNTPNGKLMIAVCRELLSEPWRRKTKGGAAHASESVRLAAERLRYECETTNEQESGFAKDILTLVEFAESHVGRAAHANE